MVAHGEHEEIAERLREELTRFGMGFGVSGSPKSAGSEEDMEEDIHDLGFRFSCERVSAREHYSRWRTYVYTCAQ